MQGASPILAPHVQDGSEPEEVCSWLQPGPACSHRACGDRQQCSSDAWEPAARGPRCSPPRPPVAGHVRQRPLSPPPTQRVSQEPMESDVNDFAAASRPERSSSPGSGKGRRDWCPPETEGAPFDRNHCLPSGGRGHPRGSGEWGEAPSLTPGPATCSFSPLPRPPPPPGNAQGTMKDPPLAARTNTCVYPVLALSLAATATTSPSTPSKDPQDDFGLGQLGLRQHLRVRHSSPVLSFRPIRPFCGPPPWRFPPAPQRYH
ncbi:putative RNA-binding protein 15B [Leucoraja erinacea]|uniref:putative RNA-binding protein 15B n=1 Tax=Leucoraja erinaceus TaxID=7782 RepID=UPI00245798AD|nr:putative RNA-binding protein 15B [Leucoraja erinacea]